MDRQQVNPSDATETQLNAAINNKVSQLAYYPLKGELLDREAEFFIAFYIQHPQYRHEYSGISNTIKMADEDKNNKNLTLQTLPANFVVLKEEIQKRTSKDGSLEKAYQMFHKLYDHVMLEVTRRTEQQALIYQLEGLNKSIEASGRTYDEYAKQLEKVIQEVDQSKSSVVSQTVTVLGIFTAIAMAFFGGFKLLEAGLIADTLSVYRLSLIILLVSFSVYNIIIGLMFIIARICGKDIGVRCKVGEYCEYCEYHRRRGGVFCQAVHKYPFITVIDFLLLYFIYCVTVLWLFTPGDKYLLPGLFPLESNWVASVVQVILLILPLACFVLTCLFLVRRKTAKAVRPHAWRKKEG